MPVDVSADPGYYVELLDPDAGMAWSPEGQLKLVFGFMLTDGNISEIERIADPEVLATLDFG